LSRRSGSGSGRCSCRPLLATSCGTASATSTGRRSNRSSGSVGSPAWPSPTRISTERWWSGAGRWGAPPIHVPQADLEWVQRPDNAIRPWAETIEVLPGVTLVQCGGHFAGSAVLHWAAGAGRRGALLVGDTMTVVPDVRFVSFMRSYPNHIPLPAAAVRGIVEAVRPFRFDRVYGGWWDRVMPSGGIEAVERSAERYLRWAGVPPS
jgi:hypothetical protein